MSGTVARARALVGTRFRPQGRDRRFGLDCVGLVIEAFGLPADAVRRDYRLRGVDVEQVRHEIERWFRRVPSTGRRPGDLLMFSPGAGVIHFAIGTGDGVIHADARHGVVERPGEPAWTSLGVYRRRVRIKEML